MRKFMFDQKVVVLLLFVFVVPNTSSIWHTDSEERVESTRFRNPASRWCKSRHNNHLCRSHCNRYSCNGRCTFFGKCKCYEVNHPPTCEIDCSNRRRLGCPDYCECWNGGICIRAFDICSCSDGWEGVDCSQPCSEGHYGYRCEEICECMNNATCDHKTGECRCDAGYRGPYCEERCPNGTHGDQCLDECKCQNDAICHHVDGTCDCGPGWTGPVCAERCPDGQFGINCSEECACSKHSTCNFITGECNCNEGFYSESCDVHCLSEEWGNNRSQKCNYTNAECASDEDTCLPGFHGKNCAKLDCDYNKWGVNCSLDCKCENGGVCHPITEKCCCKEPWIGKDCSVDTKENSSKQYREEVGSSVIIAAICVPALTLLLIVIGALFYRKNYVDKRKGEGDSGLLKFSRLSNE